MADVGRPTILDEEMFRKIKQSILDGKTLRDLAKDNEINEGTLYEWHSNNYLNLADKIEGWRRDRKLMLAEKNIEEILGMTTLNTLTRSNGEVYEATDTAILRVKADISKFVSETLGKDYYSKRSELTGKNGDALKVDVTKASDEDLIKLVSGENTSRT